MKLLKTGNNTTEIEVKDGRIFLFSYDTPIAIYDPKRDYFFFSVKKHSRTTSKHLRQWKRMYGGDCPIAATQEEIDRITESI
jgi:hypothetical protein